MYIFLIKVLLISHSLYHLYVENEISALSLISAPFPKVNLFQELTKVNNFLPSPGTEQNLNTVQSLYQHLCQLSQIIWELMSLWETWIQTKPLSLT